MELFLAVLGERRQIRTDGMNVDLAQVHLVAVQTAAPARAENA